MFDMESFGSNCPTNWKEIADYLNEKAEGMNERELEALWEDFCMERLPDCPKTLFED